MNVTKTLYVIHRDEWRAWLQEHYQTEPEIWLVYYRKHTGKPRIAYSDAVEEALCFGWIDSTVKTLDQERYSQRFSPRKPGRVFSQANQERLRKLIAQGMVMPHVLATLGDLFAREFEMPEDIVAALQANPQTWANFQSYPEAYQRIRIAFVDGARHRPAEFDKRLNYLIKMTAQNKQFGFGIDEFF